MIEVGNVPSSSFGRLKLPQPQLTTASMSNSEQSNQNSSYLMWIENANELRHGLTNDINEYPAINQTEMIKYL